MRCKDLAMTFRSLLRVGLLAAFVPGCATLSFGAPTVPTTYALPAALASSVAAVAVPASLPAGTKSASHWSYSGDEGPDHWGALSSDYALCATGKSQTPIDISVTKAANGLASLLFNYPALTPTWGNNGHTLQMDYPAGGRLTVGDRDYDLAQFHFHAPSEHTVNGVAFPMEMHIVHKDAAGNLAVIGVLIKAGAANPAYQAIWTRVPATAGDAFSLGTTLDPASLLPASRDYYTYSGSLTTPPCTEGVRWLLMTNPVELSAEQIAAFTRVYGANSRPVQALNGRDVQQKAS
jgi:carbonic anhydrase